MNVALVSLDQAWEDKGSNLLLCKKYVQNASKSGVDLIIFPEMTLTGFSLNIDELAEDRAYSNTIDEFQILAKGYDIAIHFGVIITDGVKACNMSIMVDKLGSVIAEYAKVHPFTFAGEDKYYNSGSNLSIVRFEGLNIGLSICYDLRFPELYSALAKSSDVIINIANWPRKRVDHWNSLLKARAIENQIFVVGVNRIGTDGNGLEYLESSQVFNANGENLAEYRQGNMKIFELDKLWTKEFRDSFLTVKDRKNNFYRSIL